MFDLHSQTIIGMIIIAIGTLVGTFYIQRGNALKSKESTAETRQKIEAQSVEISKLNQQNLFIQGQNENLTRINEQQNVVLDVQSSLINTQIEKTDKQLAIIEKNRQVNLVSNFNEYQQLTQKYSLTAFVIYEQSCPKNFFLNYTQNQVEQIDNLIKKEIDNIQICKFVTSNQLLLNNWTQLKTEISSKLYLIKVQEGNYLKENSITIKVDRIYRDNKYKELQSFLTKSEIERQKIVMEILNSQHKN